MPDMALAPGGSAGRTATSAYGRWAGLLWLMLLALHLLLRLPAALTSYPVPEELALVGATRHLLDHGSTDLLLGSGLPPVAAWITAPVVALLEPVAVESLGSSDAVAAGVATVHQARWRGLSSAASPWLVVVLLRLPTLLLSLATLGLVRRIGQRAFGSPGGLLAAAVWALCPLAISADSSISLLGPTAFAAAAIVYATLRLHDLAPAGGRAAVWARRRLAFALGLGLAVGPAAWPLVLACGVATPLWRRHRASLGERVLDGAAGRWVLTAVAALAYAVLPDLTLWLVAGARGGWVPLATSVEAASSLATGATHWAAAPLQAGLALPLTCLVLLALGVLAWPTLRRDRAGGPTWLAACWLLCWTTALAAPEAAVTGLLLAGLPAGLGLGVAAVARRRVEAPRSAALFALGLLAVQTVEVVPHLLRPRAFTNWITSSGPDGLLPATADQGESTWRMLWLLRGLGVERVRYVHALPPEAFEALAGDGRFLTGAGELIGLRRRLAELAGDEPLTPEVVVLSESARDDVAPPEAPAYLTLGGLCVHPLPEPE